MSKISTKEIFVFCFCLTTFLVPNFGEGFIINTGGNASLIASLIGMVLGVGLLFVLFTLMKHIGSKNIFLHNKDCYKRLGSILNILLIISAIYIAFITIWITINFIITQFINNNSYYPLAILFIALVAFLVAKNKEVMGRTLTILLLIFTISIILIMIFLVPNVTFDNLLPILNTTSNDFIKTIILYPALTVVPLFFILGIHKKDITDKENINKKIIFSYLGGSLFIFLLLFFILTILGIEIIPRLTYPLYYLFKKISALGFLQRIENIISIIIMVLPFGAISYFLYFIKEGIRDTFSIKKEKNINSIIYVLSFFITISSVYLFQNYSMNFLLTAYPYIAYGVSGIFIIIFLLNYLFLKSKEH